MSDPGCPVCKDCGAALVGPHCHLCGQRAIEGRLRFADVGRWLVGKLLDADRGLLLTIREMTRRPGAMIRRYVDGQRTRFTNPFAYLFIFGALYALVWSFTPEAMRAHLAAEFANDVRLFGPLSDAQVRAAVELWSKTIPYTAQLELGVCLPLVFLLRLAFRRTGHTLAEIAVFALFVSGQIFLVCALAMLPLLATRANVLAYGGVVIVAYAVVVSHAAVGFFGGRRFRTALKAFVAVALAMTIYDLGERAVIRWYVLLTTR